MTKRPEDQQTGDETEITPEMIEAGAEVFVGYDSRFEGPDEIVQQIFEVMLAISPTALIQESAHSVQASEPVPEHR